MKRSIIVISIIGMLCAGLRWHSVSLCMPENFSIVTDSYFSSFSQSIFYDQLMLSVQKKKSIHDTVTDLKNSFACIKDISITYRPSGALVKIGSYKPECIINETSVFVSSGDIFERSLFSPLEIAHLPSFLLSQEVMAEASYMIPQVLCDIPAQVHAAHVVHIMSKHCITLTDKNNAHFSIMCSVDQDIPAGMFDQCEMVKKNIATHAMVDRNSACAWVLDTRFANYIVAYRA